MLRLLSRSRFIISFRFSGLLMYFVMMVKLCLSSSSSPSSWGTKAVVVVGKRRRRRRGNLDASLRRRGRDSYLERLPFGDVVFRVQQLLVFTEELERRKRVKGWFPSRRPQHATHPGPDVAEPLWFQNQEDAPGVAASFKMREQTCASAEKNSSMGPRALKAPSLAPPAGLTLS